MSVASPFLAPVVKRVTAAAVDAGPTLLFVIFSAAIADAFRLGPEGTLSAAVVTYVAYHAVFNCLWSGETPGRRMVHIRVVSSRGGDLSRTRAVLRPVVRVAWFAAFFPVVLRSHTFAIFLAPLFTDLFLMSVLKWRQTTADFLCGTLVVNAPAVQPHRAPAGPMYSATDAEFGVQPRRQK